MNIEQPIEDETEIKIEYKENFEIDPLKLKNTETQSCFSLCEYENDSNDYDKFHSTFITANRDIVENIDKSSDCSVPNIWYKSIDDDGKYLCRFCDLKYSTVQTLRYHNKTKHREKAITLLASTSKNKRNKRIKCHICNILFAVKTNFEHHLHITHSLERLQRFCHLCKAFFEDEIHLSVHLKLKHNLSITTLHTCTVCGYRTSKLSHYKQHKNTHDEPTMLKCGSCDYTTNYTPNLRIHMRIHDTKKRYSCDHEPCDYSGSSKSALNNHKLKHNKENNYVYCDKCTYRTVYKQSLKRHQKSHFRNSI